MCGIKHGTCQCGNFARILASGCWAQLFIMDILKKLNIAQVKYEKAMGEARNSIADKVDFNFSLQWQPSDGWTIVHDNSDVAPMEYVLSVIKRKGRLSYEDFREGTI